MKTKGFTLIELMVVILIVAILAAVAIPILRGRIDAAKWSEGKAILGTIATAVRAYSAEKGDGFTIPSLDYAQSGTSLGFAAGDLTGTYFADSDFALTSVTMPDSSLATPTLLTFTITCTATSGGNSGNGPSTPPGYTLDNLGAFVAQ